MALVGNTDCHGLQPMHSMASVNQLQANKQTRRRQHGRGSNPTEIKIFRPNPNQPVYEPI